MYLSDSASTSMGPVIKRNASVQCGGSGSYQASTSTYSLFFFVVKQQQKKNKSKITKKSDNFSLAKIFVDFRNQMQKGVACSTGMSVRPPVAYHPAINGHPNNDKKKKELEEDDDR